MTAYIHAAKLHEVMKNAIVDYNTFLNDEEIAKVREALVNETKDSTAMVEIVNIDECGEILEQAAHKLLQSACNRLHNIVVEIRSILKHDVAFDIDYEKLAYNTISVYSSDIPYDVLTSEQSIIVKA